MSLEVKMKVGSYYYNKHAGVLRCIKHENELYEVSNKCFMYVVNELGEICTLLTSRNYNLEYECDEYGNEIYVTQQTVPTKIDLELKIDTTAAISSLKELQSELEKVKSVMYSEPGLMQHDKLRAERISFWFEDLPEQDEQERRKHSHYFKDVSNLDEIDVYAVLTLFEVNDPCIAHAAKKLLCTGNRGHKDFETDVQDALDSLVRWKELNQDLTK